MSKVAEENTDIKFSLKNVILSSSWVHTSHQALSLAHYGIQPLWFIKKYST